MRTTIAETAGYSIRREDALYATFFTLYLTGRTIPVAMATVNTSPPADAVNWSAVGDTDPATVLVFADGLRALVQALEAHRAAH